MTQEQLKAILDGIASLAPHGKGIYDYVQLLLPILTGLLGWMLSAFWQNRQFRQNNAKEQYYAAREKAESLNAKYTAFLLYVQGFYDEVRTNTNGGKETNDDEFVTFVTTYQTKLAEVHQTQRIFFPANDFSTKGIVEETKALEKHLIALAQFKPASRRKIKGTAMPTDSDVQRIERGQRLGTEIAESFERLTLEVSKVQVSINQSLKEDARRLGIVPRRASKHI